MGGWGRSCASRPVTANTAPMSTVTLRVDTLGRPADKASAAAAISFDVEREGKQISKRCLYLVGPDTRSSAQCSSFDPERTSPMCPAHSFTSISNALAFGSARRRVDTGTLLEKGAQG